MTEYNFALYRAAQVNFDDWIVKDQQFTALGFARQIYFNDVAFSDSFGVLLGARHKWEQRKDGRQEEPYNGST